MEINRDILGGRIPWQDFRPLDWNSHCLCVFVSQKIHTGAAFSENSNINAFFLTAVLKTTAIFMVVKMTPRSRRCNKGPNIRHTFTKRLKFLLKTQRSGVGYLDFVIIVYRPKKAVSFRTKLQSLIQSC